MMENKPFFLQVTDKRQENLISYLHLHLCWGTRWRTFNVMPEQNFETSEKTSGKSLNVARAVIRGEVTATAPTHRAGVE